MTHRTSRLVPALLICSLAVVVSAASRSADACGGDVPEERLVELADQAVAADDARAVEAREILRHHGPEGLRVLLETYRETVDGGGSAGAPADAAPLERWHDALDHVAAQKDAHASGLYWYTDLAWAQAAASAEGKPILSLRLLGHLDDDLSCANSRFFRTVLYPHPDVARVLHEQFVLHWQSVRPVPVITIEFGDGRKIRRTITGNSIHYVLDAEGRPLDALPGLYGPQAFLRGLSAAVFAHASLAGLEGGQRRVALAAYHEGRLDRLEAAWTADLAAAGLISFETRERSALTPFAPAAPTARQASVFAVSKSAIEVPILEAVAPPGTDLEATTDAIAWDAIAALHVDASRLHPTSIALMRAKHAEPAAGTDADAALLRTVDRFERNIAMDTVRNEYLLHRRIHRWFATGEVETEVDALNERVYADLFLTPSSDPWLGLVPADTYVALEGGGLAR
ncbi:MAG: hypothetical protein ACYTG6_04665 [Planctomycetota bacterium]|jgi:hypothetical protein